MNKQNLNKVNGRSGITLIALVVTIVVLLILAAITINMVFSDNGIIKTAGDAGELQNRATQNELNQMNELSDWLQGYLDGTGGSVGDELAKDLKVGDYVKYGDKLTVGKTATTQTSQTGMGETQTFTADTEMLWRVINIKSNGEVELVATKNTLSTDDAGQGEEAEKYGLYLNGKTGFLNAETVLNNLCSTLYTNPSYGTARSIKIQDINNLTQFNPTTSEWGEEDEKEYYLENRSFTYTSGAEFWDETTNTFKTPSQANPVTVENSYYYYTVDESMTLYDLIAEPATYEGEYDETNYPMFYWLGSRCAGSFGSNALFNVRGVASGVVGGWTLCGARVDR